jgi:hypothetical protein
LVVNPLGSPPDELRNERFGKLYFPPERLVRVSTYHTGEPYFGASGRNRFDAPGAMSGAAEFSVCYLGSDLEVAIAESVLHDEVPVNGSFQLTCDHIDNHYALYFGGRALHLLNLTGPLLKRLGGSADLAGTSTYAITQQWSHAVYSNPSRYDGFVYMSRHLNSRRAVALFDRAADKLRLTSYSALGSAKGFRKAVKRFGIELV